MTTLESDIHRNCIIAPSEPEKPGPCLAGYRSRLAAHRDFIVQQLASGRVFPTGEKAGWVDIPTVWESWFLIRFAPREAERPYAHLAHIVQQLKRRDRVR